MTDTIVYAVSGRGAIVSNDGNKRQELAPGDFALIPAYVCKVYLVPCTIRAYNGRLSIKRSMTVTRRSSGSSHVAGALRLFTILTTGARAKTQQKRKGVIDLGLSPLVSWVGTVSSHLSNIVNEHKGHENCYRTSPALRHCHVRWNTVKFFGTTYMCTVSLWHECFYITII